MNWKKVIFCLLALIVPYLFLGFFSYPSADDFTYAIPALQKGFLQAQMDWYNQWSGRFISTALLSVSPVVYKSYLGYKFIGITTFSMLLASLWCFLSSVLGSIFEPRVLKGFFILFITVYLSQIPSITEAFHWYAGVVNYTYAFVVFLVSLSLYLKTRAIGVGEGFNRVDFQKGKCRLSFVLSVSSFLLAGFNETLVVIWLYLIFVLEVFYLKKFKKIDFSLALPFVVGLISFVIVFKAPGNAVRAAQFHGNHDILFTLFRPLGLFVEIFFRYLKLPLIIVLWLTIPEIEGLKTKIPANFYSKSSRWLTLLFFLSLVFLFLAPAHWAIGGAPPRRAMNILCFIYLLFTVCMYCQWVWAKDGKFLSRYQRLPRWLGRNTQIALLLVSFFAASNHGVAWADLLFRARDYASQQEERISTLEKSDANSEIVFEPLRQRPETLFFSEFEKDPSDWINKSISDFYKVKSVRIK